MKLHVLLRRVRFRSNEICTIFSLNPKEVLAVVRAFEQAFRDGAKRTEYTGNEGFGTVEHQTRGSVFSQAAHSRMKKGQHGDERAAPWEIDILRKQRMRCRRWPLGRNVLNARTCLCGNESMSREPIQRDELSAQS